MSSVPGRALAKRKNIRDDGVGEYGCSYPLGATIVRGGANFSVYSRGASRVELLLFERADDLRETRAIALDPAVNRTYHYWHTFVPHVRVGQIYGYRVHGPWDPANGMRFDPSNVLLDPYGRAVAAMKSVLVDSREYDWEGDVTLKRP